jgi:hypothetical protein
MPWRILINTNVAGVEKLINVDTASDGAQHIKASKSLENG